MRQYSTWLCVCVCVSNWLHSNLESICKCLAERKYAFYKCSGKCFTTCFFFRHSLGLAAAEHFFFSRRISLFLCSTKLNSIQIHILAVSTRRIVGSVAERRWSAWRGVRGYQTWLKGCVNASRGRPRVCRTFGTDYDSISEQLNRVIKCNTVQMTIYKSNGWENSFDIIGARNNPRMSPFLNDPNQQKQNQFRIDFFVFRLPIFVQRNGRILLDLWECSDCIFARRVLIEWPFQLHIDLFGLSERMSFLLLLTCPAVMRASTSGVYVCVCVRAR